MEYKLIMAVSGFRSLYDSTCETYRDLNQRSGSWRQVAQIVGVPEAECRRKWKMLRDQHRRERQREKERRESGVGLFNYRPWRYSAILSFLNPFIDARAAGTNGWALDPQPPQAPFTHQNHQNQETVNCSTTTGTRSDDDDNYGFAVADATTTSSLASSSSFDSSHRKRPSSSSSCSSFRDPPRLKEAKMEAVSDSDLAAADDPLQVDPAQQVNLRELFEVMMQSVTSLASTFASHSSSSSASTSTSDQLMNPASRLKTEEQDQAPPVVEELDPSDEEEVVEEVEQRHRRRRRRSSSEGRMEEFFRRMEAREVQREQRDPNQRDDVSLFLLSLAPALRRLPAEKQSLVRMKIQQFVHEAEFGVSSTQ